jgi:sulfide:quinone oxidoreductase
MKQIVVLGAGIGGMSVAYELRAALGKDKAAITVVGEGTKFSFTPSNPLGRRGVGASRPTFRSMHPRIWRRRPSASKPPVPNASCRNRTSYDYLVIAPARAWPSTKCRDSVRHRHTQSICTTAHAQTAWEAYQEFLKDPARS